MPKRKNVAYESLVISLVRHLYAQKYSHIRSVLAGYEKPDEIFWPRADKGYAPDAAAEKGNDETVFAVETDDSVAYPETEARWKLFEAYAHQQSRKFVVVVSKESEEKARQLVKDFGITVDGVWAVT